ncbi:hypothetical protein [Cohnella abietis]|uniref:Gram-positive cocci surface proteins LPxTG domain-containing protein n=1 Tax=Cohnella abietis TaxID=2507935 RepID=A0A3T1D0P4_9BACL|nr:hypothetical protein [Cohnella abietis]BBI31631.1 hypothetical protein KCTCHS21_10300 [Cohnella abietis]
MKIIQKAIVTGLLLVGLALWGSAVSASNTPVPSATAGSALPSCHYTPEDDGKPIKIVKTSAAASTVVRVEEDSISELKSGAWLAAGIVSVVILAGVLFIWINRRRSNKL